MFVLTQTVRAAEVDESVAESQSSWLLVGHEKEEEIALFTACCDQTFFVRHHCTIRIWEGCHKVTAEQQAI